MYHKPAGYGWVGFQDIPDYDLTIAEIRDFIVVSEFRRRGLAMELMEHIERTARELGANLLRSETGAENYASQSLHRKYGFQAFHISYEKRLTT